MITCITPTRERPQQLALVIECMNRQTVKPDLWIIVDDGFVSQALTSKIKVPFKYIGYYSLVQPSVASNCIQAFRYAKPGTYIVIEDDDYYPDTYVECISKLPLMQNQLCGDGLCIDYRLSSGHYIVDNHRLHGMDIVTTGDTFAPWHGTFFKGQQLKEAILQLLYKYAHNADCDWRLHSQLKPHFPTKLYHLKQHTCISLKGYTTGLPGVVKNHRSSKGMLQDDDNYSFFKQHVPHWKSYQKFLGVER